MSVRALRHDKRCGRFSKSRGLSASVSFISSPPPPRLLAPFFARSLLGNSTETLATQASIQSVRVKDGKSLWNGMWNGVRNGIITRNTIYAGNKLTEERILFSRQFYKSSSFFDVADY